MTAQMITYQNRENQATELARIVAADLKAALEAKGKATLAVPGGTTPGPFLTALSNEDLDWANVTVMLTDERFVPETSDRSNTRLIRETLLQNKAAAATFVPFYKEAYLPEHVLDQLIGEVERALPLDVCVLGMGDDMHTASLFPGADRLDEALEVSAEALYPMRAPGAPETRMTLSAPVLRDAPEIHILINGEGKRVALNRAQQEGPWSEAPVRAVLSAPGRVMIHYTA
jgi:6-phosphogluconolactonase